MHFQLSNLTVLPAFLVIAALWVGWKEAKRRSLGLRMLPPELRPTTDSSPLFDFDRGKRDDDREHPDPLWTLQDCQMELLTEGTMHAFETGTTTHFIQKPGSANFCGRVPRRTASWLGEAEPYDSASVLRRTLQRYPDMVSGDTSAIYQQEPQIEDRSSNRLSYADWARRARIAGAAR